VKLTSAGEQDPEQEFSMVSVVIPTFNRADLLGECIDSALAQDYPHFEVIVVDDGSTDDTPQLCASYGSRIRYYRKPNGGAASALNYGIGRMQGSWFKWLSSDDLLERGAVRTLVTAAQSTGAQIAYGDFLQINSSGKVVGRYRGRGYDEQDEFVTELWYHFVGSAVGAVIGRSSFDTVGLFDESIRYGEDYDWWLRAALIHRLKFTYVPAAVGRYRLHSGQISKGKAEAIPGLRRKIRTNVAAMLVGEDSNPDALAHYARMTRRYQKEYAPLLVAWRFLSRSPGSALACFWAGKLAPGWTSRLFWASTPPLAV
jgi:glycosyltransferase involved in cell wall biosynthesis